MKRSSYLAAIVALAVASTAAAQRGDPPGSMARQPDPDQPKEVQEAQAFQNLKVPGHRVSRAVKKLRRLKWYSTLTAASTRARQEKKPIIWIQALGTLKGHA